MTYGWNHWINLHHLTISNNLKNYDIYFRNCWQIFYLHRQNYLLIFDRLLSLNTLCIRNANLITPGSCTALEFIWREIIFLQWSKQKEQYSREHCQRTSSVIKRTLFIADYLATGYIQKCMQMLLQCCFWFKR